MAQQRRSLALSGVAKLRRRHEVRQSIRRLAVGAVLLLAQILVLLRATMTGDHTLHRDAVLHARSVGDSGAAARSSRSQQAIRY